MNIEYNCIRVGSHREGNATVHVDMYAYMAAAILLLAVLGIIWVLILGVTFLDYILTLNNSCRNRRRPKEGKWHVTLSAVQSAKRTKKSNLAKNVRYNA
jgi:hypothetical protein